MRAPVAFLIWILLAAAWADGGYFKQTSQREARPDIPSQSAILRFRDGEETLIIDSQLRAPEGDYVWCIPVPSNPIEVGKVRQGSVEAAHALFTPPIETRYKDSSRTWLLLAALGLGGALAASFLVRKRGKLASVLYVTLMVSLGWTVLCLPIGAQTKSFAKSTTVPLIQVGNYDVGVSGSSPPEHILQELTSLGLDMSTAERRVVDAYAREGWSFVTFRLRKGPQPIYRAVHPVSIRFRTEKPIYPMRLTWTQTERLRLDLFVVANVRLGQPELRTLLAKRMPVHYEPIASGFDALPGSDPIVGRRLGEVGHPDLVGLLWPGAFVTHLRGDLRPSNREDLELSASRESSETRATLHSPETARLDAETWATVAGLSGWIVVGFVSTVRARFFGRIWLWGGFAAAGLGLATGFVVYSSKWIVEASDQKRHRPEVEARYRFRAGSFAAWSDPEKFREALRRELEKMNVDSRVQEPGTPGGYTLRRESGGWIYVVYDRYACPQGLRVKPTGEVTLCDEEGSSVVQGS